MSLEDYPRPSSDVPPPYPPRSEPPPRTGFSGLFWLLLFLLAVLAVPYLAEQIQYSITRGRERAAAEVAKALDQLPEVSPVYRMVAKAIAPSVVGVEAIVSSQEEPEDEWTQLFGQPRQRRSESLGSGVIVGADGYIVTNAHVVRNAADVIVKLSDARTFDHVQIVGDDPLSDIAVLKISSGGLIAAAWGDSDQLEVGDPVMAIGNPYGLERTVTTGILSAKGRHGVLPENLPYQNFLQTDAAVNPGNSGGPLVNLKAQVVGINTAIVGQAFQGISFAIPSNMAKEVYERLKESGKVVRGWLGVELQPLDEQLAKRLGVKGRAGVAVTRVLPGGPADRAGIEAGDVIIKWNGKAVEGPTDLTFAVGMAPPGTKVAVVVLRGGQQKELTVTVEERPTFGRPGRRR